MNLRRALLAAVFAVAPSLAFAQSTPVYQTGLNTSAHDLAKITRNGQIMDAGNLLGDTNARGVNPFAVQDSNALGLCFNTTTTNLTYYPFCFGHDGSNNGLLSFSGTNVATVTTSGLALLGGPTAPTVSAGDATTKVATDAFVQNAIGAAGISQLAWEPTNTSLIALSANTNSRAARGGVNALGDAGTQIFTSQSGSCSSHSWSAYPGKCVNDSSGNFSWVAAGPMIDASQYGIPAHGSDGTAQAQAALDDAYQMIQAGLGPVRVMFPRSFDFTSLHTYAGVNIVCGGDQNRLHRTASGPGLYDAVSPSSPNFPNIGGFVGSFDVENCSIDGGGLAGSNISVVTSPAYLRNVSSYDTDSNAAVVQGTVSTNVLTVASVIQGTVHAGQMVICRQCGTAGGNAGSNTYATINAFGSGGTTGSGSTGTYQLSLSFTNAIGSNEPILLSTPWTWSSTGANTSFPSANAYIFGNASPIWVGGNLGGNSGNIPSTGACSTYNGIGLALESVNTNGGGKPDAGHFIGINDWCNIVGRVIFNGSDNTFDANVHQNTIVGAMYGIGASDSDQNRSGLDYVEPGVVTGQAGFVFGANANGNSVADPGSLGGTFSPVVLDSGSRNSVSAPFAGTTYRSGRSISSFWPGYQTGAPGAGGVHMPLAANAGTHTLDADDNRMAEFDIETYGSGYAGSFVGIGRAGTHASPGAVGSGGQYLAVFGGRGQYDTTVGDECSATIGGVNGYPCGYMAVLSAAGFSNTSTPTQLQFFVTPVNSTTPVEAMQLAQDGSLSLLTAGLTVGSSTLISSSTSLFNGAAAQTATLTNAPAAGNPTKWVRINDNGVTRYIPAW